MHHRSSKDCELHCPHNSWIPGGILQLRKGCKCDFLMLLDLKELPSHFHPVKHFLLNLSIRYESCPEIIFQLYLWPECSIPPFYLYYNRFFFILPLGTLFTYSLLSHCTCATARVPVSFKDFPVECKKSPVLPQLTCILTRVTVTGLSLQAFEGSKDIQVSLHSIRMPCTIMEKSAGGEYLLSSSGRYLEVFSFKRKKMENWRREGKEYLQESKGGLFLFALVFFCLFICCVSLKGL